MIDDMHDPNDDMDDDDDDDDVMDNDECQIHLKDDMIVMDSDLNNEPFINGMNNANNSNNVNHYMNISSSINPNNLTTAVNDYYQNVMQMQNGESV